MNSVTKPNCDGEHTMHYIQLAHLHYHFQVLGEEAADGLGRQLFVLRSVGG